MRLGICGRASSFTRGLSQSRRAGHLDPGYDWEPQVVGIEIGRIRCRTSAQSSEGPRAQSWYTTHKDPSPLMGRLAVWLVSAFTRAEAVEGVVRTIAVPCSPALTDATGDRPHGVCAGRSPIASSISSTGSDTLTGRVVRSYYCATNSTPRVPSEADATHETPCESSRYPEPRRCPNIIVDRAEKRGDRHRVCLTGARKRDATRVLRADTSTENRCSTISTIHGFFALPGGSGVEQIISMRNGPARGSLRFSLLRPANGHRDLADRHRHEQGDSTFPGA
jgi:hypothetical protein